MIISQIPVLGSSMDEKKKRILCTETIKYVGGSIAKRPLPLAAKPASSRMILIVGLASSVSGELCSTDTDTCIGIGPIRIYGYVIFLKNPIRGYVLIFLETNNIIY